ncbi:hypothetical protein DYB25_013355 [Aphanomyces astaci]|uniref:Uncharacterized protein n=2 Tax=Aphanomyces astaci TaxID=112090 RepID=A0A397BUY3_APHAT|nr:hypothetical protein DYB25_013355 [Aphanomyces astaci]
MANIDNAAANIRRNIKAPQQPEIDSQLAAWVVNANDKGASITGQVIKRKGQLLARESSTWMAQSASPADGCIGFNNTFKMYRMHGEAASANSSVQLNDDMCAANRKILLVWDNTSSHNAVGVELTHGSLPFTSSLARVTRTRSMETVVAVPLPPPNQAKMDELRMQSVEHVAASSSQSHVEKRLEEKSNRQLVMAAAMEKNLLEQEAVQIALLRQQEDLVHQQDELKRTMANQAKATAEHQEMLRQASDAMRQQHYTVEELSKKVRRDSERWGLFAEGANQRSSVVGEAAAATSRVENPMGVQHLCTRAARSASVVSSWTSI